jgi:hypothetical protein
MNSPRENLEAAKQKIRKAPQNETALRPVQAEASIDCAIEVAEALISLRVAVEDMANRSVLVIGNLMVVIEKATAQAILSSDESTKVAKESANLSAKLNRLTKWIIIAAILSALAAIIQAGTAVYAILK